MSKKYCSICGCEINGYDNNAYPITNGRCCDSCDVRVTFMRAMMTKITLHIDNCIGKMLRGENDTITLYLVENENLYILSFYKSEETNRLAVYVQTTDESYVGEYFEQSVQNMLDKRFWRVDLSHLPTFSRDEIIEITDNNNIEVEEKLSNYGNERN